MSSRILIWHLHKHQSTGTRIGATYYIEADYTPVAVRIYAETAPKEDAEFNIYDDGVSIFSDRSVNLVNQTTGVVTVRSAKTTAVLPKGDNSEEDAEEFGSSIIDEGSWVHCNVIEDGGGENFTVQLELESQLEPEEQQG